MSGGRTQREKRNLDFIVGLAILDLFEDFTFVLGVGYVGLARVKLAFALGAQICSEIKNRISSQKVKMLKKGS